MFRCANLLMSLASMRASHVACNSHPFITSARRKSAASHGVRRVSHLWVKRNMHPFKNSTAIMATSVALAFIGLLYSGRAMAQITPPQEYSKRVGESNSVGAFADFGDQVNLRDGKLSLRTTDIELPGTGPTIRLTRTFNPDGLGQYSYETSGNGFGAWELEIPRIRTITSNTPGASIYSPVGWQVAGSTTTQKNARCTGFTGPGRISFPNDVARGWEAYEWWNGYHLVDDGGNDQLVMMRTNPTVRTDLLLMTTGNWLLGCLSATTSGEPGEAFYALAPDGTKYWFNHLVYTSADELQKPLWSEWSLNQSAKIAAGSTQKAAGPTTPTPNLVADYDFISRRYAAMLVTRIEDRFGNWLTYHYTAGRLDSIDASDGRHLGVTYGAPGIATVTVGSGVTARTWTYAYTTAIENGVSQQLTVTRPDGSKWQYALQWQIASAYELDALEFTPTCPFDATENPVYLDQSITSPAGATLTLRVTRKRFGRSYVPKECWNTKANMADSGFPRYPSEWFAFAVTSRTLSGPGLTTAVWNYTYSPANSSWLHNCPTPTSCTSEVWTDVTRPDGSRRRSIFSNKFDETENKLKREEDYTASSVLLRAKDYAYATVAAGASNPYPWPVQIGNDYQTNTNVQATRQWAPVRDTAIAQQGKSFIWQVPFTCGSGGTSPCFNEFAQPTKVKKVTSP